MVKDNNRNDCQFPGSFSISLGESSLCPREDIPDHNRNSDTGPQDKMLNTLDEKSADIHCHAGIREWVKSLARLAFKIERLSQIHDQLQKEKDHCIRKYDIELQESLYNIEHAKLEKLNLEKKINLHEKFEKRKRHLVQKERKEDDLHEDTRLSEGCNGRGQTQVVKKLRKSEIRAEASAENTHNEPPLDNIGLSPPQFRNNLGVVGSEGSTLVRWRSTMFPDGASRKLRSICEISTHNGFCASADDGSIHFYVHDQMKKSINKYYSLGPSSLKLERANAESIDYDPEAGKLIAGFKRTDTKACSETIAVMKIAELRASLCISESSCVTKLRSTDISTFKSDKIKRGITSVKWGPRSDTALTATTEHTVVLWSNLAQSRKMRSEIIHSLHKAEIRCLQVHSNGNRILTGGMDGLLVAYSLEKDREEWTIARRKPLIEKINEVLEHPHDPHTILISAVSPASQRLLLYDIRAQRQPQMTMEWPRVGPRALSQYILPRWSPSGMYASCGSTDSRLHIWDIRSLSSDMSKRSSVLEPNQSLTTGHGKMVLQGFWSPSESNSIITISTDRHIGLHSFHQGVG